MTSWNRADMELSERSVKTTENSASPPGSTSGRMAPAMSFMASSCG